MLGLGLSLQKGISAFNAGRALVSSYIRRVTEAGGVLQNTACDAAAINELNQDRLLEPASWVLVPDGIEEDIVFAQKPTSGLGDLTFTRASDATYTDSTGVVRRSPYNLFTQSVWTGGGLNVAPTGWTQGQLSGNFEPQTPINGNVPYRFYGTIARRYITQTIALNAGQDFIVSVFVDSVTISPSIASVISTTASVSNLKYYVNNVEVISITPITANTTIAISFTATVSASGSIRIGGGVGGSATYDFVISQPQASEGTDAKPYFATTNRQDVPRLDYRNADGSLNSCPRLLLEPQRTNSIRNSTMVGVVAGSPGTAPTNWSQLLIGGLTRTVVGTGTENGLSYVDIRYNGTATGASIVLGFETVTGITASTGQVWTGSFYAKTIASSPNAFRSIIIEYTSVGGYVTENNLNISVSSTLNRVTHTYTLAGGATVARVLNGIVCVLTIGATYDFTIRIAAPQMELGAYATTFIPTTTAAVTRLADLAFKTGVSNLIGQTEGTLFYEFSVPLNESSTRSIGVNDGTISNRINISVFATALFARVDVGGVNQVNSSATIVPTAMNKVAFRYKANDFAAYVNGVKVITDTSGSTFSGNTLSSFSFIQPDGTSAFNGNVGQIAFFKTALTDDQLEVLTSEGYGTYALLAQSLNCVLQ
jgi:hypothetical protein